MASLAEAGQRRLSILRRRCDGPDAAVQRLEVGVARRCHARPRIVQRVVLHHRQLRQNRLQSVSFDHDSLAQPARLPFMWAVR